MVTVAFSELRQNLTQVAEKVANEGEEVVVFKRSKPLFKIVPLDYQGPVAVEYDAAQERGCKADARHGQAQARRGYDVASQDYLEGDSRNARGG